jgi:hypothetical protein
MSSGNNGGGLKIDDDPFGGMNLGGTTSSVPTSSFPPMGSSNAPIHSNNPLPSASGFLPMP